MGTTDLLMEQSLEVESNRVDDDESSDESEEA
jgi:hypothetical protein